MAPQFPVASRTRARTKKEDTLATIFSKAEPRRRKGCPGAEIAGSGARQRDSSVLGGLGAGSVASDDPHEVIIITENEDGTDEAVSESASVEEEEEPCDYRLQIMSRFKPNRLSRKGKNIAVDDDVGGDSNKEEGTGFQSDDDLICCGEMRSFREQSERNGRSSRSEYDNHGQNLSQKNTPSVTGHPKSHLSSDYLTSPSESSTEADDSSDEDFMPNRMKSLSPAGEYSSSSEEYMSGSQREENLERRKEGKCEDKGQSSDLFCAGKNNKKRVIDDAGSREDVKHGVSGVSEWLQNKVEEEKEEGAMTVDRCNVELDRPSNDGNGNSGQMEERENFSVLEHRGSRVTEERGRGGEDDDKRLQEKGKAANEFDGVNDRTNVSSTNEKRKMGEVEVRGNFALPEEEGLKQSRRGESTSGSNNICGVDRGMEQKRYGKQVLSDSDAAIGQVTSPKVEGRKERDLGLACSSQRLQKKRKHDHCNNEKVFADGVAKIDCRASWKSRTRKERARKPWLNKFFELADCLWLKDELLQHGIEKRKTEKGKQRAEDSTEREGRKESTECGILIKPREEGIEAHRVESEKRQ